MAMSRYLYFPGCKLTPFLPEYDRSTRAVLAALAVDVDDTELNCCGYPVRHNDFTAAMLCGTRVLAMAARKDLPLLTLCKCCYGNLKQADYWMRHNTALRHQINTMLGNEGLNWREDVVVRHLLTSLDEDIGRDRLAARVRRPLMGLKVAAHCGCHALRPGDGTRFDNPLALALMRRKRADAHESGAQMMITACTYCQLQLDGVHREHPAPGEAWNDLPVVLVSQLLAVAFGLPGFEMEGLV